jgi:hypothetical protein
MVTLTVVESFNNGGRVVAIVNFSVPDDVKKSFDRTFAGMNKSAIVAQLMRQAVEERRLRTRRRLAIDRLLRLRRRMKPVAEVTLRATRVAGRP